MKLLLAVFLSLSVTGIFAAPPEWVEGQLIVKPRAGLSDAQFEKILSKSKGQSVKHLKQINARVIKVPPQALEAVKQALSNNPHIDFVEKNPLVAPSAFTPNDPSYPDQWHLSKIQAPTAWDVATGNGITVAILDSGVEGSHPDLAGSMVPGRNVVSNNTDTSAMSVHGTAVAGAIAATGNNSTGVASVVWNASIMPIRISNRTDGWAEGSDMVEGVLWAADHGADVVNISYDFGNGFAALNDAAQYLRNKGGLVVMSAGNNNTDYGFTDNPYIIHTSATNSSDAKASFSNFGDFVDVSAPGKSVLTVWQNGGYGWGDGTSFSSPVTAGVIALIKAANPDLTASEVETILKNSADDLGSNGWDKYFGHGRVNAATAVQMASQTAPSDTQAPGVNITSPAYSNTVSGNVLVEVDASDDTGVSQVVLYANGQSVGTDSTAPYQFSWNSAQVADGNATLTAYAYDAANNTGISPGVTVNVDNQPDNVDTTAPSVIITSPAASSNVISGTVKISVNASDDTGVTDVVLYVNGQIAGTDSTAPYEFNWDSTQVADGDVTFVAHAYDAANNKGTSSTVGATIDNQPDVVDNAAPSVAITNPGNGSAVSGTVSILASASDDTGVTQLSVYIDGSLKCSSVDVSSLSCSWNTRKLSGTHTITALASDAKGNSTETSVSVSIATGSSKGNKGKGKNK
jgi:subtilisin family serine protease